MTPEQTQESTLKPLEASTCPPGAVTATTSQILEVGDQGLIDIPSRYPG